mmetsp:Transcript_18523/g.70082  ORF Transcript_18523/g.70082 Transcript_18523/m.70082 type:complete len:518 (-) Transcript_18523:1563-3116(-)
MEAVVPDEAFVEIMNDPGGSDALEAASGAAAAANGFQDAPLVGSALDFSGAATPHPHDDVDERHLVHQRDADLDEDVFPDAVDAAANVDPAAAAAMVVEADGEDRTGPRLGKDHKDAVLNALGAADGDISGELKKKILDLPAPRTGRRGAPQAFPHKLYQILCGPHSHAIRWTADGGGFVIVNQEAFQNEILPDFFRHRNFTSFQRQLNLYGFRKLVRSTAKETSSRNSRQTLLASKAGVVVGASKDSGKASREAVAADEHRYWHPSFRRDQPKLISKLFRARQSHHRKRVYVIENNGDAARVQQSAAGRKSLGKGDFPIQPHPHGFLGKKVPGQRNFFMPVTTGHLFSNPPPAAPVSDGLVSGIPQTFRAVPNLQSVSKESQMPPSVLGVLPPTFPLGMLRPEESFLIPQQRDLGLAVGAQAPARALIDLRSQAQAHAQQAINGHVRTPQALINQGRAPLFLNNVVLPMSQDVGTMYLLESQKQHARQPAGMLPTTPTPQPAIHMQVCHAQLGMAT